MGCLVKQQATPLATQTLEDHVIHHAIQFARALQADAR